MYLTLWVLFSVAIPAAYNPRPTLYAPHLWFLERDNTLYDFGISAFLIALDVFELVSAHVRQQAMGRRQLPYLNAALKRTLFGSFLHLFGMYSGTTQSCGYTYGVQLIVMGKFVDMRDYDPDRLN